MAFTKLLGGLDKYTGSIFGGKKTNSQPKMRVDSLLTESPVELDVSKTAHMSNKPFSFSTVSYPENPDINMEGHYMLFHILTSTPGLSGRGLDDLSQIGRVVTGPTGESTFDIDSNNDYSQAQQNALGPIIAQDDRIDKLRRPGIVRKKFDRTKHMISLYMPPNVTIDHKTNYSSENIGLIDRLIRNLKNVTTEGVSGESINDAVDTAKNIADKLGQQKAQLESNEPFVVDRQEVLFQGIDFRTFSFEYNFIPTSESELKSVYNICELFRYHSRPRIEDSNEGAYDFVIPSRFLIQFMYRSKENTFLNRIGTVVCTNVSITYGDGDTWKTFRPVAGAHFSGTAPVKTNLKLEFQEIDLIDKDAINLGF